MARLKRRYGLPNLGLSTFGKAASLDKTLIVVKNAWRHTGCGGEPRLPQADRGRGVIVGDSVPMKALRQQIGIMAPTNGPRADLRRIGSGKELVALAIHARACVRKVYSLN